MIPDGQIHELEAYLKEHPDHVNAHDLIGTTLLHQAGKYQKLNIMNLLLDLGAEVNASQGSGWTPLSFCAKDSLLPACQLLLDRGANLHHANESGWNATHCAADTGQVDALRLFMGAGADIHAVNVKGFTALHVAARNGHLECVKLLVEHGADQGICSLNAEHLSPLMLAQQTITPKHQAVSQYLQNVLYLQKEQKDLQDLQDHSQEDLDEGLKDRFKKESPHSRDSSSSFDAPESKSSQNLPIRRL